MSENLAQFFKGLPADYRRGLVLRVLDGRDEGEYRGWMDRLIDEHVAVNGGFRGPKHALEPGVLVGPMLRTLERKHEVTRQFVFALRQLLPAATAAAKATIERQGWPVVEDAELTKHIAAGERLSIDELRRLVNDVQAVTDVDRRDASLLCTVLVGRLPAIDDHEAVATEAPVSTGAGLPSAPLDSSSLAVAALRQMSKTLAGLAPAEPGWDEIVALLRELTELARGKLAERDRLREETARHEKHRAELSDALTRLRAEAAEGLKLLGAGAARVDEWDAEVMPAPSLAGMADLVGTLRERLVEAAALRHSLLDPDLDLDQIEATTILLSKAKEHLTELVQHIEDRFAAPGAPVEVETSSDEGAALPPIDVPGSDDIATSEEPPDSNEIRSPDVAPEDTPRGSDLTQADDERVDCGGASDADARPDPHVNQPSDAAGADKPGDDEDTQVAAQNPPEARVEIADAPWEQADCARHAPSGNARPDIQNERSAPPAFPAELTSYRAFRDENWMSPLGACERAPWREPNFAERLRTAAVVALTEHRLAHLWILDEALAAAGERAVIDRSDLEALAAILTSPSSLAAGSYSNPERPALLRGDGVAAAESWRLKVFLEAIRPSSEIPLSSSEAEAVVDAVGFADANLRAVVLGLLKFGSQGADPLAPLRGHLLSVAANPAQAAKDLAELRTRLHAEYTRVFRNAGGTVLRNHCKEAWSEFMAEAGPVLRQLFPAEKGGLAKGGRWDTSAVHRSLGALLGRHAEIADRRKAAFQDRGHMDRSAEELVSAAVRVNELAAQIWDDKATRAEKARRLPVEHARRLLDSPALERPEEELCRLALLGQLSAVPRGHASAALHLTLGDIAARPQLLSLLPASAEVPDSPTAAIAPVQQTNDVTRAAAVLLEAPCADEGAPLRVIARRLTLPPNRWLQPFAGALLRDGAPATPADELQLHAVLANARRAWRDLDSLASRVAQSVWRALEDASKTLESCRGLEPALCGAWLERLTDFAREAAKPLVEALAREAEVAKNEEAQAAVRDGRYADARLLLSGIVEHRGPHELRETAWRPEARARYPQPLEAILQHAPSDRSGLLDGWARGLTKQAVGADRKLRTTFVEQVIGGVPKGANQTKEHVISCEVLRARLKELDLNPTFLPQLARFKSLVVLSAPAHPSESNFAIATAGVLESTPETVYAVLAPRISAALRDDTLREFRKRNLNAAIVDDLDLCRLLRLRGQRPNGLIALFEVILEQLPWMSHFAPFTNDDGQNVLVEMYVGRHKEALEIARTATYSRLFSGRKLGKSALISYVHDTQNQQTLQSGNTLHVLTVAAVGAESDAVVVAKILEQLKKEVGFTVSDLDIGADPAGALARVAKEFVHKEPKKSLLVILDEADQFVEAQIAAYERDRERCLSFRMRSEVQAYHDEQRLPRIRFLFAGYRTTNLNEGAWANWGEVLTLRPLSLEEGAQLVAGPLARIGLDASTQASAVAYRCGCQPAVIISFGRTLLRRIDRGHSLTVREGLQLDPEIAAACNEESVQEEIRTIARNNFRDNPRARILFQAVLQEFSEYPSGAGIREMDARLMQRLAAIDPDLSWLHVEADGRALEVARLLRDFVSRELLTRSEIAGAPVYHLRFAHHLPTLLQHDAEQVIRQEIRSIRHRGQEAVGRRHGLLAEERFEFVRNLVSRHDPEYPVRAVVVGSHWQEAVSHMSGGIPDRIGIPPDRVFVSRPPSGRDEPRLAVSAATPKAFDEILSRRATRMPPPLLIGGADLVRHALSRAGGDLIEIVKLGRVPRGTVAWWFERIRGLEFHDADWLEKVMAVTSGVPWLLRWVEQALVGDAHGGIDISTQRLAAVIGGGASAVRDFTAALVDGPASARLTPRELEIVRMLAIVGREYGYRVSNPFDDLSFGWEDYHRKKLDVAALDVVGDSTSVNVVQALGVVPLDPSVSGDDPMRRLFVPPEGDVLYRLAGALGPSA